MSSPGCDEPLPGDGGAGWDLVSLVVVVVIGCRKDDVKVFIFDAGKGFGAANLVSSFVTFV
jgi:hypothetical protein